MITSQIGMFAYAGMTEAMCDELMAKCVLCHSIYASIYRSINLSVIHIQRTGWWSPLKSACLPTLAWRKPCVMSRWPSACCATVYMHPSIYPSVIHIQRTGRWSPRKSACSRTRAWRKPCVMSWWPSALLCHSTYASIHPSTHPSIYLCYVCKGLGNDHLSNRHVCVHWNNGSQLRWANDWVSLVTSSKRVKKSI